MPSGFLGRRLGPLALASRMATAEGLLSGLVAYWPLNEAGGANDALDLHASGLHLTQVSSPGSDVGKIHATARTFDGTDDYFTDADNPALRVGNFDWHIAVWTYRSGDGTVVAQDAAVGRRNFELQFLSGCPYFYIFFSDGSYWAPYSYPATPIDTWSLVEGWLDTTAKTINVAINNRAPTLYSYSGITPNSAVAKFQIGAREIASNQRFTGRIGPMALWKNRILSTAERTALWNGGVGLEYAQYGNALKWYCAGGAPLPVVAYKPIGATGSTASYVNLANPGVHDAVPGVAPTFDAATGWTVVAASGQFLTTGVAPTTTWTVIIRIANLTSLDGYAFGAWRPSPQTIFGIGKGAAVAYYWNGNSVRTQSPTAITGVFAIAGAKAYRDGVDEGVALPVTADTGIEMYIGALNQVGVAASFASCDVLAFVAYDTTLTAPQVAAVSAAMAAL